ncbi:MAG: hypothetical protein WC785_06565 [Tatlockia sp.]|jgi:hypothetical protein
MKVNIQGLPKPQVLMALFENAKKSQRTYYTVAIRICKSPEPCIIRAYQTEMDDQFKSMVLTEGEAQSMLSRNLYVDYHEMVAMKILFSENEIDTSEYDRLHYRADDESIKKASDVIKDLKKRLEISQSASIPAVNSHLDSTNNNSNANTFWSNNNKAFSFEKIKNEIVQSINATLQSVFDSCSFLHSTAVGSIIEFPWDTSLDKIDAFHQLLEGLGFSVKIEPQTELMGGIVKVKPKLKLLNETLDSIVVKLQPLVNMLEKTAAYN